MTDKVSDNPDAMDFWAHAEALRSTILRAALIVIIAMAALFAFMPWIFDHIILAPCRSDFITYRIMDLITEKSPFFSGASPADDSFEVKLINIQLASQFFLHMSTSFWLGLILSFPAIIYLMWRFVEPALYENEKRGVTKAFLAGNMMFYIGVAAGYFAVFPVTLRFLADYRLSELIPNQISLDSYMDNFCVLILMMGIVFELPLLAWLLGRMGIINRELFGKYRRHAIVALLILAAVITPTGDPFTLMVVFLPLYLLFEISAFTVPGRKEQINSNRTNK